MKSLVVADVLVDGDMSQQWRFTESGELEATSCGLVLTVKDGSAASGAKVWLNKRNSSKAQKWAMLAVGSSANESADSSKEDTGLQKLLYKAKKLAVDDFVGKVEEL